MLRRQKGGWLVDDWDNLDPDIVFRSLEILTVHTETYADSLWRLVLSWDPEELLEARDSQIMALARYGRQSVLQWGDVDVQDIRKWYERLRKLLERENAMTQVNEG